MESLCIHSCFLLRHLLKLLSWGSVTMSIWSSLEQFLVSAIVLYLEERKVDWEERTKMNVYFNCVFRNEVFLFIHFVLHMCSEIAQLEEPEWRCEWTWFNSWFQQWWFFWKREKSIVKNSKNWMSIVTGFSERENPQIHSFSFCHICWNISIRRWSDWMLEVPWFNSWFLQWFHFLEKGKVDWEEWTKTNVYFNGVVGKGKSFCSFILMLIHVLK